MKYEWKKIAIETENEVQNFALYSQIVTVCLTKIAESILFTIWTKPIIAHWNRFTYARFHCLIASQVKGHCCYDRIVINNNSLKIVQFQEVFVPFSIVFVFVQSHQVLIFSFVFEFFWFLIAVVVVVVDAFALSSLNGFGFILTNNMKCSLHYTKTKQRKKKNVSGLASRFSVHLFCWHSIAYLFLHFRLQHIESKVVVCTASGHITCLKILLEKYYFIFQRYLCVSRCFIDDNSIQCTRNRWK